MRLLDIALKLCAPIININFNTNIGVEVALKTTVGSIYDLIPLPKKSKLIIVRINNSHIIMRAGINVEFAGDFVPPCFMGN